MTPKLRILTTALWGLVIFAMCALLASWTTSKLVARRTDTSSSFILQPSSLPVIPAPTFSMTDQTNHPFSSADLRGKVWIADFFFTTCTGPCPAMTGKMGQLAKRLADVPAVHFVSFTVDPETDTPAALQAYADKFHADPARWHFLTGGDNVSYNIARDFKLAAKPADGLNPILHTTKFVLINPEGNVAGYFDFNDPADLDRLAATARALVAH